MESQVIEFTKDRETKNTVRYAASVNGEEPAVETLYIQKSAFGKQYPETVKITLEWEE